MNFELRHRDMLARLGKLKTKSGTIATPVLLPVINPAIQPILPRTLSEEFNCRALMTNAYILKKKGNKEIMQNGVHSFLDFDGVVMTDSGAYQILVYGEVDVSPAEIVHYQEQISTDVATILDIPTSWHANREIAKDSVQETIKRAKQLKKVKTRDDILWVAPIQGGKHLDLVAYSAKNVGKLPFPIHALGSPTTIMEQYLFDTLVEMILTAKMNMPMQRPLHLFGAGHPFMFALAVALGCDIFDSAAYAIYARQNRFMTEYGTSRLNQLEYFPCSCSICAKHTPKSLRDRPPKERQEVLAKHNLYVSFAEMNRIKQAIVEGRLWEYVELRAHAHPTLLRAVKILKKYEKFIERNSPVTKNKGLFFFSSTGLMRPEVVRYKKLLDERYTPPKEAKILILLPSLSKKPFHKAKEIKSFFSLICQKFPLKQNEFHICVYAAPFGVIPIELDETYPLSQHEVATPLDLETMENVAEQVKKYVAVSHYKKVILIEDSTWRNRLSAACGRIKRKDLSITVLRVEETLSKKVLSDIIEVLEKSVV
ncbi:MAG: tRNA guanosine(15) transglycosylase TgtA [Candidatus Bathyarchaeota archaeon]|nr:MAG: tRNA guanosine(15) transglycosylase TgtA [Candidatus Bathyarchaeota archaeon]